MDLEVQKLLLRMLSYEELVKMFPRNIYKGWEHCGNTDHGWICTRQKDHDGPHLAQDTDDMVLSAWINDDDQ